MIIKILVPLKKKQKVIVCIHANYDFTLAKQINSLKRCYQTKLQKVRFHLGIKLDYPNSNFC